MNENDIGKKLKQAKSTQRELHICDKDIRNFLEYLRVSACNKSTFILCGCMDQIDVNPSFHRAFQYFTKEEKIEYYYKITNILKSCIQGDVDPIKQQELIKPASFYFFNEEEGQWQTRSILINFSKNTLKFLRGGEIINFRYYIVRTSKKKGRQSLALESTQSLQFPTTIRISNNKESFEQLKLLLQRLMCSATRQNFIMKLTKNGQLPRKKDLSELNAKKMQKQNELELDSPVPIKTIKKVESLPMQVNKLQIKSPQLHRRNNNIVQQKVSFENPINKPPPITINNSIEYQKMKLKLVNSLTNTTNLKESPKNVFIDEKENRVRKMYQIKENQYKIPLEWFSENLMTASCFKRWKKTLKQAKNINIKTKSNLQKNFHQVHEFKQKMTSQYLYQRQKFNESQNAVYFLDISAQDPQSKIISNNKIEYVIWKFERNSSYLSITVQAKITHNNLKGNHLSLSLTQQFLGNINEIQLNANVTLLDDSGFNINTVLFQENYLSQLRQSIRYESDDQFHSIDQHQEVQDHSPNNDNLLISLMRVSIPGSIADQQLFKEIQLQSSGSLANHNSTKVLKWKHPMVPFPKSMKPKLKLPNASGKCPFWQNQFKFNQKGEMICINTKKMEAQKGVIGQLVKMIGRNLVSGKSILNISIPVTVFSYDSNLSLLCKSYAYAPLLLEKAAASTDPVERIKYVVAFGINCTTAYIQMDKPFNPILGETYHCLIDGCPVYGQQTSHHPPISSLFMKGRGYTVYGNFEAKVNMSFNSAKGSNDGITHVSFNEKDFNKNTIKFTCCRGEVSGLVIGQRILKGVGKAHYLDVDHMLFLELTFGKHKGITQYCKFQNGIEGKLVQLAPFADISNFPNINAKDIVKEIGIFSGKWTEDLYFQDSLVFNSWKEYPYLCEEYPSPLQSDTFYRKDLLLRMEQRMEEAQSAKEELENIQRNDRKLRKKYTGRQE